MQANGLNPVERKTALSLALVFGLRMLGLFMIMPIFAVYGQHLAGYSPLWVGLAIGAYGLTQALFQIPMGMLSDRIGRKPVIYLGLAVFALGSLVAALSDSVYGVTLGRAIQGMGAVAAAVLALAADVTREPQRPKVMAMIGICIGLAFAVSLVVGPALAAHVGLQGLFGLTALLALVGIAITRFAVPRAVHKAPPGDSQAIPAQLLGLLADRQLLRLDAGIFLLHLTLTALFVALPLTLVAHGFAAERHWLLYFPALLASFVLIVPMLIYGARQGKNKQLFLFSILLMAAALLGLTFAQGQLAWVMLAVVAYFTAFNFLEASLPAFISMLAPAGNKGSAMGIYSCCQFFGAFCGGLLGGGWYQWLGANGVFVLIAALMLLWFVISLGLANPNRIRSYTFGLTLHRAGEAERLAEQLSRLPGVLEVAVVQEQQAAYLKVNGKLFEIESARQVIAAQQ